MNFEGCSTIYLDTIVYCVNFSLFKHTQIPYVQWVMYQKLHVVFLMSKKIILLTFIIRNYTDHFLQIIGFGIFTYFQHSDTPLYFT